MVPVPNFEASQHEQFYFKQIHADDNVLFEIVMHCYAPQINRFTDTGSRILHYLCIRLQAFSQMREKS